MADSLPFIAFNFSINLELPGEKKPLFEGAFSECDGLEMSMSPKSIREGGNNGRQIHLAGPISYGQLTLKRGMTPDFSLWKWFKRTQLEPDLRASGTINILAAKGGPNADIEASFTLTGCLPIKLKAPSLSAKDGAVAIEEIQLAYETLDQQEV